MFVRIWVAFSENVTAIQCYDPVNHTYTIFDPAANTPTIAVLHNLYPRLGWLNIRRVWLKRASVKLRKRRYRYVSHRYIYSNTSIELFFRSWELPCVVAFSIPLQLIMRLWTTYNPYSWESIPTAYLSIRFFPFSTPAGSDKLMVTKTQSAE